MIGFGFDTQFSQTFIAAILGHSPLINVRKEASGFEKKMCICAGMRKPGNMDASLTALV